MPPVSVTGPQIAALRLQTLGLAATGSPRTPAQVARHLLALQAQDFTASRWAIGSRTRGSERDVLDAYDRGEIVRSWPMRRTVHVTAAEDLHWMLALTGVRALNPKSLARSWANTGLDEDQLERARDVAIARLSGGGRATRAELGETFAQAGLDVAGPRMYHTVWYLAQTGTLVQGPTRGTDHELVLLDEWVPEPRRLGREDALRELVVRYLGSHGPATVEDLVWWSGLTKTDVRAGIEQAGQEVLALTHASRGAQLWVTADTLDVHELDPAHVKRSTFMLAPFDEHLLGYADREDVLRGEHARAVDPMRNGVFRATIVHGGQVVGIWRVTRRRKGLEVALLPLTRLTATQIAAATRALTPWAAFRGEPLLAVVAG